MAEVLLIHGSCFGAWAWDRVIPPLSSLGHDVQALDLPGRDGADVSLHDHAVAILGAIKGRAVLVGHSAGGYPITLAASLAPARVRALIYIAAYIPQPDKSLADLRRAGPSQPMRGAFQISADGASYRFDPARCPDLFFHDTDDLTARMRAEPIRPQETPFPAPLPRAPRAAIIARDDRAIPPAWQREMAKDMPQEELASGHCPHLSQPSAVASLIHRFIATELVAD
jgi:pimeloyl-ACP methyl ester carboxylesterase